MIRRPFILFLAAAALTGSGGCCFVQPVQNSLQTSIPALRDIGPSYKPSNFYAKAPFMPAQIRRVAVLPLAPTSQTSYLEDGVEAFQNLVVSELIKTKRFEVIPITESQMIDWTGRPYWRMDETLPHNFLKKIQDATACDGILFSQLTRFQPYQPVAIGWKLTLIETKSLYPVEPLVPVVSAPASQPTGTLATDVPVLKVAPAASANPNPTPSGGDTFWSVDEVLDSGDPDVARASRCYYNNHLTSDSPAADVSTMATSPARFGQYTLYALLGTLPQRPDALKTEK